MAILGGAPFQQPAGSRASHTNLWDTTGASRTAKGRPASPAATGPTIPSPPHLRQRGRPRLPAGRAPPRPVHRHHLPALHRRPPRIHVPRRRHRLPDQPDPGMEHIREPRRAARPRPPLDQPREQHVTDQTWICSDQGVHYTALLPRQTRRTRGTAIHEPQGLLLGQRTNRELLGSPQGTNRPDRPPHPKPGHPNSRRLHPLPQRKTRTGQTRMPPRNTKPHSQPDPLSEIRDPCYLLKVFIVGYTGEFLAGDYLVFLRHLVRMSLERWNWQRCQSDAGKHDTHGLLDAFFASDCLCLLRHGQFHRLSRKAAAAIVRDTISSEPTPIQSRAERCSAFRLTYDEGG